LGQAGVFDSYAAISNKSRKPSRFDCSSAAAAQVFSSLYCYLPSAQERSLSGTTHERCAINWNGAFLQPMAYMGVQQTYGGIARVVIPLWAGFSYDHFGKGVPFITSSILVLGSLFLGLGVDDGRKVKAQPEPVEVAV